jgi:hypothetical protein
MFEFAEYNEADWESSEESVDDENTEWSANV